MKQIPLTRGKFVSVDDEDFEELSKFKWYYTSHGYAARRPTTGVIYMHRVITDCPHGMFVDHKNQDTLDNTRANLRICTKQDNQRNHKKHAYKREVSSKYRGVHYNKKQQCWTSQARFEGKARHLGNFKTEEDAAKAYNDFITKHHGQFVRVNII